MADFLTPLDEERMIQDTGGVTVVHGGDTTYGHEELPGVEVEAPGGGRVITTHRTVVIPDGRLTGIGPKTGIDEVVTVDGTARTVHGIQPGSDDGVLIRLFLAD